MNDYKKIRICVVGLGYVGMPLAVGFAKNGFPVIGFDINREKIDLYKKGIDLTNEVGDNELKKTSVNFTTDEKQISNANFIIVAVPTPINIDHTPDLTPIIESTKIIGNNLSKNSIIVYESTVYPGCTEDVCVPILEKNSQLKCGIDFKIAYSPERINPGDKVHKLENIKKIVSGMDEETLKIVKQTYDAVIKVGTYPVSNIRTAEAIKVVENSQRDINIAFMNELAMVFDKMDIDTNEVIDGMNTKWNALGFRPGLVGGHCIGVDPYYFTYQAEKLGYHSQIILNGRIVNDSMGEYIANQIVKELVLAGCNPKYSNVVVLGLTFKENCPDVRNSKVNDIIKGLKKYDIKTQVVDPWVNKKEVKKIYNIDIVELKDIHDADCVVIAVAHNEFKNISIDNIKKMYKDNSTEKVLIDIKGIYSIKELKTSKLKYWRL